MRESWQPHVHNITSGYKQQAQAYNREINMDFWLTPSLIFSANFYQISIILAIQNSTTLN